MDSLDQFWSQMLSGDPAQIRLAWDSRSAEERAEVRQHLDRMRTGMGWHPSQRESAEPALQTIETLNHTL
jgi:hypothetical protein